MKQIILSCIKKKLLIFLINRNFNFFELYCGVQNEYDDECIQEEGKNYAIVYLIFVSKKKNK